MNVIDVNDEIFRKLKLYKKNLVDKCKECNGLGSKIVKGKKREWSHVKDCKCMREFKRVMEYVKSGIDEAYWKWKLKDFKEQHPRVYTIARKYIINCKNVMNYGLGLYITGSTGTGKTTLANVILKNYVRKEYTCYFISVGELLEEIFKGFRQKEQTLFLDFIKRVDVLVIDELGREHRKKDSTFVVDELDTIIRRRERKKRPIIITSNLSKDEVKKIYKDGVSSLLSGNLKTLVMTGDDLRRTKVKNDWENKLMKEDRK